MRYYIQATENVKIRGDFYKKGEYIKTPKKKIRSFSTYMRAKNHIYMHIGVPNHFPLKVVGLLSTPIEK